MSSSDESFEIVVETEEELQLKNLIKKRTVLRGLISDIYIKLEKLIYNGKDLNQIEVEYKKGQDKYERMIALDQNISESLHKMVKDEEDLEREIGNTEQFREKWLDISCCVEKLREQRKREQDVSIASLYIYIFW